MEVTKADILQTLPKLSQTDLVEIKTRVDFLTKLSPKETSGEILFYESIQGSLVKVIGAPELPFPLFKKTIYYREFHTQFLLLEKFLSSNIKEKINRRNKLQLYHIFLDLITSRLQNKGGEISVINIIRALPYLPTLIELAYPNYIQSGLLVMLAQSRNK